MPFDLHVLGLPLAFILSQDQTLHRIVCLFSVSFVLALFTFALNIAIKTITSIWFPLSICRIELFFPFFPFFRAAKVYTFLIYTKKFFRFFISSKAFL